MGGELEVPCPGPGGGEGGRVPVLVLARGAEWGGTLCWSWLEGGRAVGGNLSWSLRVGQEQRWGSGYTILVQRGGLGWGRGVLSGSCWQGGCPFLVLVGVSPSPRGQT